MKKTFLLTLLSAALVAAADQSNFVLIFVDDLGYADIGETENVTDANPQVVERLLALAGWARIDIGDGASAGKHARGVGKVPSAVTLTWN